jgi:Sec-independent protein translocase protein TatA
MFGLSMEHLLILLVAALFVIGPERLPDAVRFLTETRRKICGFASGAQETASRAGTRIAGTAETAAGPASGARVRPEDRARALRTGGHLGSECLGRRCSGVAVW